MYSVSLSVKNIAESFKFYQNLGFEQVKGAGGVKERWLILTNGKAKIGLFQGMFPKNTMTFNPSDARKIYHVLKENNIEFSHVLGKEFGEGPFSFSFVDPDGNPILIDQHR